MSHVLKLIAPKLPFADPEYIADGVAVHPIDFSSSIIPPPFKASYFQVLPGCCTPLDEHKVEESWIVLKGSGTLIFEDEAYRIHEHDIFFFPPFHKHQVRNDSNEALMICSIYW
jgi:mannose-6-phosphate isomerase-like protein (cupin superfamily)